MPSAHQFAKAKPATSSKQQCFILIMSKVDDTISEIRFYIGKTEEMAS